MNKSDMQFIKDAFKHGTVKESGVHLVETSGITESAPSASANKCADEVLKVINYSSDSAHGRKIIEIIKRHFA